MTLESNLINNEGNGLSISEIPKEAHWANTLTYIKVSDHGPDFFSQKCNFQHSF